MGEKLEFKTGFRTTGECDLCNETADVVPLDKGRGLMHFCKRHYWDALKAPNGQTKPKKGKGKGKGKEQLQEVAEVPVQ